MVQSWKLLDSTTLGSTNANLDTPTLSSPTTSMRIIVHGVAQSADSDYLMQFGTAGTPLTSNYNWRNSRNGGSEDSRTAQSNIMLMGTGTNPTGNGVYAVIDIVGNIAGEEKACIWRAVSTPTGSSAASEVIEGAGKLSTSAGQLNFIRIYVSSGTFAADSTITVWGAQDEPNVDEKVAITNVPVGTRYEETNTRKIFRRTSSAWVEKGTV